MVAVRGKDALIWSRAAADLVAQFTLIWSRPSYIEQKYPERLLQKAFFLKALQNLRKRAYGVFQIGIFKEKKAGDQGQPREPGNIALAIRKAVQTFLAVRRRRCTGQGGKRALRASVRLEIG
ncbi:hypothetical protein ASD99_31065 [Mesorhizobium sp. Root695]|nr:hypothetical protein ASD99_31065 [Mesorhizobium sp. Root695]